MKLILSFYFFLQLAIVHSQVNDFYGIDMNKDWYSLTDLSKISFEIHFHENPDAPYVSVPTSKSLSLEQFSVLGLSDVQLYFNRNSPSDFHIFKPMMCTANIIYKNDDDFNIIGQKDLSKVKSDLIKKYGQPTQNVNGTVAKTSHWDSTNYEIALTLDLKTLELILMYRSKN